MSSKMLFWTVFSEKSITCDINSLWNVISSPSNLDLFHPFCKKNTVVKWSKENSIDHVEYLNGLIFQEKFLNGKKIKVTSFTFIKSASRSLESSGKSMVIIIKV